VRRNRITAQQAMSAYCSVRGRRQYRLSAEAQNDVEAGLRKPWEKTPELTWRDRILS